MSKTISTIMMSLLLVGIVDQIEGDIVKIEYVKGRATYYTDVSLSQSACSPKEGQKVHFFKDYKVVSCEEN